MRVVLFVLALLVAISTSGAATARPVRIGHYTEVSRGIRAVHPCSTYRCDGRRSGHVRATIEATSTPSLQFRTRLSPGLDRGAQPLLSLAGGVVVVGDSRGLAFVHSDGQLVSRADVGAPAVAPAVSPDDDLVVFTLSGDALRITLDGHVDRRVHVGLPLFSQILMLSDGVAVLATAQGSLVGVDSNTLSVVMREVVPVFGAISPVEYGDGGLVAVSGTAGILRRVPQVNTWMTSSVNFRGAASVATDGTVWGVTDEGLVASVSPTTGAAVAARSTTHTAIPPLLVSDGSMRIVGAHEVTATDSRGNAIWTFTDANNRLITGIVDNDGKTLIVAATPTNTGLLVCLDATGNALWNVAFADRPAEEAPTLSDDGVVVVLAMDRASGNAYELLGFR